MAKGKLTIADLEKLMDEAGDRTITLHPDGTVSVEPDERDKEIERLREENRVLLAALEKAEATEKDTETSAPIPSPEKEASDGE